MTTAMATAIAHARQSKPAAGAHHLINFKRGVAESVIPSYLGFATGRCSGPNSTVGRSIASALQIATDPALAARERPWSRKHLSPASLTRPDPMVARLG